MRSKYVPSIPNIFLFLGSNSYYTQMNNVNFSKILHLFWVLIITYIYLLIYYLFNYLLNSKIHN